MIGAGLADDVSAADVGAALLADGLVVNVPAPDTLRLLPPLTIGEAEVDEALAKIDWALG
jgi:acetylornithine/succinyldiaminopimelate/putrescine aminotransferase